MTARAGGWSSLCAALLGSVAFSSPVQAQGESSATIHVSHAAEPPRLEWFVHTQNGTAHDRGTVVTDFLQQQPGDGTPVSESTAAFLSYDDAYLYVVFVCQDDRAAVRANVARREDIDADDVVAVYLDTFHDRERAYVFMVNPLGVQLDGIETEGQSGDYTFDAVWHSEGHLTPDGYVVRLAIPFRSLRFTARSEQTWGIALERKIRRKNETAYWPHITKRVHGFVPQFGTITGMRDISPGRNVQVQPYGVMAQARILDKDTVAFGTADDARVGLDAKLVVRDALALDITANPDFSQVESDDPQVTINQRFEVFFPEKRPFFLENAGFFQTPSLLGTYQTSVNGDTPRGGLTFFSVFVAPGTSFDMGVFGPPGVADFSTIRDRSIRGRLEFSIAMGLVDVNVDTAQLELWKVQPDGSASGNLFAHPVIRSVAITDPVPEPASLLLLGTGCACLVRRRRART